MSLKNRNLAIVSILSIILSFIYAAYKSFPLKDREEYGFIILFAALVLVPLAAVLTMREGFVLITKKPQILIPIGILYLANLLIDLMGHIPLISFMVKPFYQFLLSPLKSDFSLVFIIGVFFAVCYAVWQTSLVITCVGRDECNPWNEFGRIFNFFFRVFVTLARGWLVLFVLFLPRMLFEGKMMIVFIIFLAIASLVWNLITYAVLPVALLNNNLDFMKAFRLGIKISVENLKSLWLPVLTYMLLLGFVVFLYVSYTTSTNGSVHTYKNTVTNVNAFWIGGYENQCKWYSDHQKALKSNKIAIISDMLGAIFLVLSVCLKITIVSRLVYKKPSSTG